MNYAVFFAFIHHLAGFALVGALVAEFALLSAPQGLQQAKTIQRADMTYGLSAGVLLLAGLLRVFYFEQGSSYYFQNLFFLAKLTLFVMVGLLSIYPTVIFVSWSKQLKAGVLPQVSEPQSRRLRAIIAGELAGVAGILLCAPLMARGIGNLA